MKNYDTVKVLTLITFNEITYYQRTKYQSIH
jgi:hypothetical protein